MNRRRTLAAFFTAALIATGSSPATAFDLTEVSAVVYKPWIIEASVLVINPVVTWKCVRWDKTACTAADWTDTSKKHVVQLSAGFTDADRNFFWEKFDQTIDQSVGAGAGDAWMRQKKDKLLFIGYFTGGGALGTATSFAGARVASHPIRGFALTLKQDDVYAKINAIKASPLTNLRPFVAGVLFNTRQDPVTANASPPTFVAKSYGIAKYTVNQVESSGYITTHELGHAGMNFLDEYTENGLDEQNIKSLDVLTPLVLLDGTWGGWVSAISNFLGIYSIKISAVLADNGNDNIATSRWPSTVTTSGYSREEYKYESGMFFGKGTYHQAGKNIMNSNRNSHGSDDGFAYAHSPGQQRTIDLAFGNTSKKRPNDRLVNAGPVSGWPLEFGSTTYVMLQDADMFHHFQPTNEYTVQVGWYERYWKTCWAAFVPYPCYESRWTTAETAFGKTTRSIDLRLTSAYALAGLAQKVACWLGFDEIAMSGGTFKVCEQDLDTITSSFLPTAKFRIPYREKGVPASQWMTTYYWRFQTDNGIKSGFTGWSSFFRSL